MYNGIESIPMTRISTRIIGIGSHHGADRLGWLLCDQLNDMQWPQTIDIHPCRTPAQLPELLRDCDSAIVLDTVITGQSAGQVIALDMHELGTRSCSRHSSHGFGISEALELARALDQLPAAVKILGISVVDATQDATEVSPIALPAVQQAVREFHLALQH